MTNGWTDIRNADVVLAMGGNPAENHPVGFRFVMEAQAQSQREAGLRRSALQPHGGGRRPVRADPRRHRHRVSRRLIHYALSRNRYHEEYVRAFTNATFLVKDSYAFDADAGRVLGLERGDEGVHRHLELGLRARRARLRADRSDDAASAIGLPGDEGVLRALHAGGGGQHLRLHAPRTSTRPPSSSPRPARRIAPARSCTRSGWTHHSHSVQLIHAAAMLQLLLGNIGRPGGGVNALRGHANIQGGTDCGIAYHNLPGYIPIPKADHESLDAFVTAVTPKPLRAHVHQLLVEHRSLHRQPAEGVLRHARHARERLRLPAASAAAASRRPAATRTGAGPTSSTTCTAGRMEGFFSFGMNPVSNGPHSRKAVAALSKLKWLVVAENFEQETATFWRDDILALVEQEAGGRADRSLPAAGGELRGEGRIVRQLGALDSVEVEGRRSAGRGEAGSGDHRAHLPQGARAVRARGRPPTRSGPASQLVVLEPDRAVARRGGEGDQRLGDRRREGRRRQRRRPRRPAAGTLRRHARRWIDAVGQLALHRHVYRRRQPHAAAIARRPERPRTLSGVGVQLARQSPHPLQPLLRRRRGPAMGSVTAGIAWNGSDGRRRARHHRRQRARRRPRRVHDAARRRGAALRARPVRRRSVVGALRAGRNRRSPIRCIRRRARIPR